MCERGGRFFGGKGAGGMPPRPRLSLGPDDAGRGGPSRPWRPRDRPAPGPARSGGAVPNLGHCRSLTAVVLPDPHPPDMNTTFAPPVAALGDDARAAFLTRTYSHLLGAILLFAGIEIFLFTSGLAEPIASALLNAPGGWLLVLGGFVVVSWFASRTAATAESKAAQYGALALFVLAEAVIFVPLLFIAAYQVGPSVIGSAAWTTLIGFSVLTAIVFFTGKDFSFLGGIVKWGMGLALVAIVVGVLTGFNLGTWFSVAMIGLAGAAILYDTSKILNEYPEDRYVAAALTLFASVALMFWYVLRLFMASRD